MPAGIPSAASFVDAPSAAVVDVARNSVVAAFASPGWLGSVVAAADGSEDRRRVVADGIVDTPY